MSNNSEEIEDDITTDACPSPPRTIHTERMNSQTTTNPDDETPQKSPSPTYKSYAKKNKTSKPKKTPVNAFANVINISNSNGIHIGSNYTINMGKSDKKSETFKENIQKSEGINRLLESTEPVKQTQLSFISLHVGAGWKDLARLLKYSEGQIDQFYESYIHIGLKEVVYQFLLDWTRNEPDEATIGKLSTALWESSQKDVVRRMAETVK